MEGGCFPVSPADHDHEIHTVMCNALEEIGLMAGVHHHGVAITGQNEVGVGFNTLATKADGM